MILARTQPAMWLLVWAGFAAGGCRTGGGPGVAATPPPPAAPRNIIVMIADGCGFNHVAAAGLYRHGAAGSLSFESFPVRLAMSTYAAGGDYRPERIWSDFNAAKGPRTDSAAAATAMSTGHKTRNRNIGVATNGAPLEHYMERAERAGKRTGVVTTVPLSHATPAGHVAHAEDRGGYAGIARQMLLDSAADAIIGCGHPDYDESGRPLPAATTNRNCQYVGGPALWTSLTNGAPTGGDADGDGIADAWTVVTDTAAFTAIADGARPAPARLLGVPRVATTLQQRRGGDARAVAGAVSLTTNLPSLATLSRAALRVLNADSDGFALMIEGGAVDWAGHNNEAGRMIEELLAFDEAVAAVARWIETEGGGWDRNLLVVTADHETGYLTGPEAGPATNGLPAVWTAPAGRGRGVMPALRWNLKDHTNHLAPFYARGAGADRFQAAATGDDPRRGRYLDNTDLARAIFAWLDGK